VQNGDYATLNGTQNIEKVIEKVPKNIVQAIEKNLKMMRKIIVHNIKFKSRNQGKIWRCKNPNKTREYKAKRRYNLKFLSINNWFVGSVGHHITKEYVMYIPKELHRSVSHNIHTGFNMNLINYEAFKWYYGFKP
jgi:hypothetical protein